MVKVTCPDCGGEYYEHLDAWQHDHKEDHLLEAARNLLVALDAQLLDEPEWEALRKAVREYD